MVPQPFGDFMKYFILLLGALSIVTTSFAEDFLPGRIESKTLSRTILAKCAIRDAETESKCIGFSFYYSASGNEADAKPLSQTVYTLESLNSLKTKPVVFNFWSALSNSDYEEPFAVNIVNWLNDYEDSWGESVVARISYKAGRGLLYGTMVPVAAALDISGVVVASPVTLGQVLVVSVQNGKIRKLLRALNSEKKILMDINRVYRLRSML
jgi:hypothetical protein